MALTDTCNWIPCHTEGGDLWSVNYHHKGAPKVWFVIAKEDLKRAYALIRQAAIGKHCLRLKHVVCVTCHFLCTCHFYNIHIHRSLMYNTIVAAGGLADEVTCGRFCAISALSVLDGS